MQYRKLDIQKATDSINHLVLRIEERFQGAGLANVCRELGQIAQASNRTIVFISRPIWWVRMGIFIMISLVLILILGFLYGRDWTTFWSEGNDFRLSTLVGFFDSFFNDVFFIGAAIFFLFQSERRVKRKSALKDLHSLRIIAHVIDMHQLTKNKQSLNTQRTFHSPKRDLNDHDLIRYLQYCIEMLSLTSKVAAAYANDFDDEVVLNAINEIEELTTGLSNKISQKIGMVD